MAKKTNPVDAYVTAFTALTPDNVETLYDLVAEDVFFTDPFNVIHGKAGFRRVFDHMYETCIDPRFTISDVAHSKTASYLRWRMTGKLKSWPHSNLLFEGMTEVHVDRDGKICKHIDHWDSASQLLRFLPFIGALIRPILKLFRLKSA
jgi:steroid delta-isomerase